MNGTCLKLLSSNTKLKEIFELLVELVCRCDNDTNRYLPMRRLAAYVIESQAIAHSLEHKPLTHLLKDCPPSKVQITDTAVMASPSRASVCLRFRSTPEMCHAHCMRVGCESQRSEFPTGAVSNKPLPAPKTKPWTRHAVSHI